MTTRFSLTIVCHWEDGGPLRRAKEVVHILFARVLLLSAPDCCKYRQLPMEVCIFVKCSTLGGRGNIQPINFNLGYYCSTRNIYTFATKLLFNILKWLIKIVDCVIFVLKK
jgi:hypothetical protein